MGQQVCTGAMTQCTFGVAPGTLMVIPVSMAVSYTHLTLPTSDLV